MNNTNESLKKQLVDTQNKLAESENNYLLLDQSIKKAYEEWIATFDTLEDPIFIHDENLHILRCNKAYQQKAGIPYNQIIGNFYFDIFPKTHTPMCNCFSEIENKAAERS